MPGATQKGNASVSNLVSFGRDKQPFAPVTFWTATAARGQRRKYEAKD
jgi:hypothetical protein